MSAVIVNPPQTQAEPAASGWVDYPVFYVPQVAQLNLKGAKRTRNARIVSLVISLGITFAIYWFFREQLGDMTWPVLAISLALPLGYLSWAVVREVVARGEASRVTDGLALGIGRLGLLQQAGTLPWSEVGTIEARSRRLGRSDDLVITSRGGATSRLPLAYLSDKPATLHGAITALSGGRCRIDFAKLDA